MADLVVVGCMFCWLFQDSGIGSSLWKVIIRLRRSIGWWVKRGREREYVAKNPLKLSGYE